MYRSFPYFLIHGSTDRETIILSIFLPTIPSKLPTMVPRRHQGGAGRKRIDTTRLIQDPAARQVAFSKRRTTLFNMAGDLSALCGAHTAIVVFSSSTHGTAYAFGSPSVDAVLRQLSTSSDDALAAVVEEEEDAATLAAMRQELQDTKARVEAEKARMKAVEAGVERAMETAMTPLWWQADVNTLGAAELPEYEAALRRLRDAVQRHVDALHAHQNGAGFTTTTTTGPRGGAACRPHLACGQ